MNMDERIRSIQQRGYLRYIAFKDKHLSGIRRKKLNNIDFTIICNNCWGGYVYRRYGLPYQSPTIGLYFFADDFLKLCADLKGYMEQPLQFISYTQSKHREELEKKKQTNIPIGKLGDIEIIFLHYKTQEQAKEKWNRRVKRINYDNLIFKFSKMNNCSDEHLKSFDSFNFQKKICFLPTNSEEVDITCGINAPNADSIKEVKNDTIYYDRYIDLTKMINAERVCGLKTEGTWNVK